MAQLGWSSWPAQGVWVPPAAGSTRQTLRTPVATLACTAPAGSRLWGAVNLVTIGLFSNIHCLCCATPPCSREVGCGSSVRSRRWGTSRQLLISSTKSYTGSGGGTDQPHPQDLPRRLTEIL